MDTVATLSIDFMISTLILMIMVSSVIAIVEGRLEMTQQTEEAAEARMLSEKVALTIEDTYSGGEGHENMISMPSNLKGSYYEVKVNQSGVGIQVGGRFGRSFLYPKKISYSEISTKEVILYPNQTYKIRNFRDENSYHLIIIQPV
jgi:hypothetical protein